MRRRTKVICTIGPATNDWETLKAMYESGMNVVRINMSHASYDDAERTIRWVGTLNRQVRYAVPIILDTQGPEIRTGPLEEPMALTADMDVFMTSTTDDDGSHDLPVIEVQYRDFQDALSEGDTIRLDNGLINMVVLEKEPRGLKCRVRDGGLLRGRRHVNLPGIHVNLPSITEKDKEDVAFAQKHDLSFIAQSFVRNADDVEAMRELLGTSHQWVKIISKIENHEGVAHAAEIAEKSDGVMVARGDLGIETDMAALPTLQRNLVESTIRRGRRCIVATHLLESMVEHPIPTRAEVVDVANAINEGVDAVMLSAETSIGEYPVRSVAQLVRIAEEQEKFPGLNFARSNESDSNRQMLAWSAVELAERIHAAGIVVLTRSGLAADMVTNCAPPQVPIFAFSNQSHTRRRLMLNRGVYAHRTAFSRDPEKTIQTAMSVLRKREGLKSDESVIVVSDVVGQGGVDSIQIREIGEEPS